MGFLSTYKLGLPFLTLKKASGYGDGPKSRSSLSIWPKINCTEKVVPPYLLSSASFSIVSPSLPLSLLTLKEEGNCPMAVQKLDDQKGLYIDR